MISAGGTLRGRDENSGTFALAKKKCNKTENRLIRWQTYRACPPLGKDLVARGVGGCLLSAEEMKYDLRPGWYRIVGSCEPAPDGITTRKRVTRAHQKPFAASDWIISRNSAGPTPRDGYGFFQNTRRPEIQLIGSNNVKRPNRIRCIRRCVRDFFVVFAFFSQKRNVGNKKKKNILPSGKHVIYVTYRRRTSYWSLESGRKKWGGKKPKNPPAIYKKITIKQRRKTRKSVLFQRSEVFVCMCTQDVIIL